MQKPKQEQTETKSKSTTKDQITDLEKQISTTKYNKKTQHAIGQMKAKLAKLKEKEEFRSSSKGVGAGYAVRKTGDCTVALLGFPSVGKSTLLNKLTNQESKVGSYAFTTLTVIPGLMEYKSAQIQILDIPGIVKGAAAGTGRGKEVLQVLRTTDLILILLEANHPEHYKVLLKEVYDSGIRINSKKPDIQILKSVKGGIKVSSTRKITKITPETIKSILQVFRINNADVILHEDINEDQFIDVLENNKIYTKAVVVLNKVDMIRPQDYKELKKKIPISLPISANHDYNIDKLKDTIFDSLKLMPIYLKEIRKEPDMKIPIIVSTDTNLKELCRKIHKDFVEKFKFARIWGKSVRFPGQRIQKKTHKLKPADIVEIHLK